MRKPDFATDVLFPMLGFCCINTMIGVIIPWALVIFIPISLSVCALFAFGYLGNRIQYDKYSENERRLMANLRANMKRLDKAEKRANRGK